MSHHHHSDFVQVISSKGPAKLSPRWTAIFMAMIVVGIAAFVYQAFMNEGHERIAWIALLHNFHFFTGLSAAGVAIAAIIQITRAFWGRPVKRFAEAFGAFLPVSFLFLILIYFGAEHIYEWVESPPKSGNKALWLQKNFLFGRTFIYLLILNLAAYKFRSLSRRTDEGVAHEHNPDLWKQPANWLGAAKEIARGQALQSKFGVVFCFCYAVCISLLAYDLIMTLDYRWFSTMFGGWIFCSFLLIGWGSLIWVTYLMGNRFGLQGYMHKKLYHDLGKLTLGFTIVWAYLFFAQLMVIWYGDLSHETGYLITRFRNPTWQAFSVTALFMVFILPFSFGLSKRIKMSPKTFGPIVLISIAGIWLERFILIAPSTWYYDRHKLQFEPGVSQLLIFDILIFLGFFGLFALVFRRALDRSPVMVISDPRLDEGINRH